MIIGGELDFGDFNPGLSEIIYLGFNWNCDLWTNYNGYLNGYAGYGAADKGFIQPNFPNPPNETYGWSATKKLISRTATFSTSNAWAGWWSSVDVKPDQTVHVHLEAEYDSGGTKSLTYNSVMAFRFYKNPDWFAIGYE